MIKIILQSQRIIIDDILFSLGLESSARKDSTFGIAFSLVDDSVVGEING